MVTSLLMLLVSAFAASEQEPHLTGLAITAINEAGCPQRVEF